MKFLHQLIIYLVFFLICIVSCETMQEVCIEQNLDKSATTSEERQENKEDYFECMSTKREYWAPQDDNLLEIIELDL